MNFGAWLTAFILWFLMKFGAINYPDIDVDGFRFIVQHATQSNSSGRNSGGTILFYKNALHDRISMINKTPNI